MNNLILFGAAGAAAYFYVQQQQSGAGGSADPVINEAGQVDISGDGIGALQRVDRVLSYSLLQAAHSEVSDFDTLTDADLEQLLIAIGINPSVLKSAVSTEQAEFLMNSAREAARLRVEITIDQATKTQWLTIIRASKKQVSTRWAATEKIRIDGQFTRSSNPDAPIKAAIERDAFMSWVLLNSSPFVQKHCPKSDVIDCIHNRSQMQISPTMQNEINRVWDMTITAEGTLYPEQVVVYILTPLIAFIDAGWKKQKQAAVDLLAVQLAAKNSLIDSTDWVSIGWTVGGNSLPIPPPVSDIEGE